jgi:hypothetical protein
MNLVDVANQLRATIIVHFFRNEKEFFPGIFWAIDIILTNYWKIYKSLYSPFLSFSDTRLRNIYREFLEALVELLFCCDSEIYVETAPGTTFKEYPKYSYIPHKAGRKPRYLKPASSNITDLSRETSFIFKGDSGRPRTSILAKITPISLHQYIKIIIRGYYFICRTFIELEDKRIAREKNLDYKATFQLTGEILKEIQLSSKSSLKGPKRIRGTKTLWKCNECAVPICRPGEPCWDIAHRRLFNK